MALVYPCLATPCCGHPSSRHSSDPGGANPRRPITGPSRDAHKRWRTPCSQSTPKTIQTHVPSAVSVERQGRQALGREDPPTVSEEGPKPTKRVPRNRPAQYRRACGPGQAGREPCRRLTLILSPQERGAASRKGAKSGGLDILSGESYGVFVEKTITELIKTRGEAWLTLGRAGGGDAGSIQ